jgi:hypothetical protein
MRTVYGLGGYDPDHPSGNRVESWDESGYTRWDSEGVVVETRALTVDESAMVSQIEASVASARTAVAPRLAVVESTLDSIIVAVLS